MNAWKSLPITMQFGLLLSLLLGVGAWTCYEIGNRLYVAEARNQARTVADLVDNIGIWASGYQGIWVKRDPSDPQRDIGAFLESEPSALPADGSTRSASFHHKNPALVQRELSDVIEASVSRAKFRMTSDKFMNPDNAPTPFELFAIRSLRQSGEIEYSVVEYGELLYARRLIATPACLSCHDSPERAPLAVRARYGTTQGFGYKNGEVAGVISVSVPLDYSPQEMARYFGWQIWLAIAALALCALSMVVYLHRAILRPVGLIENYAQRAVRAKPGETVEAPNFGDDTEDTQNEIHRLGASIKRLQDAVERLRKSPFGE